MADALHLDALEYLENRRIEVENLREKLPPAVYRLAENTLRDCVALFEKTHRLSSDLWKAHTENAHDQNQEQRHIREMKSVLTIIEEDVQLVQEVMACVLAEDTVSA